jgi:adenylate cyclase
MTIKKRILVVDDEEMIVHLCRTILTREGYDVIVASAGDEALTLASSEQFHMIVTDMLMPGMDGLETFLALREKQRELIGVLMTAHGNMDMAIEAMGHGFSGFIRKPFTTRELIQVVNDSFQKAALREENIRLKTLIPLYSLGEKFMASLSKKEILDELIETVSIQTGAQRVSVMLYEDEEGCLRIAASRGIEEEIIPNVRIKPGEKIAGWVFQTGEPLILNGGPEDNPEFADFLKSEDIIAAISFPLKAKDRCLGVLNLSKTGKGTPFSNSDIEMLSVICGQAVMAVENLRIMEEKAEKARMRTILEQYVSPEVANILISHGQNPMEVGEIRDLTVLFADIRNFTPLVQSLPLETLRSFLNDFFNLFTEIIFNFDGTLDKFMGDALLAFFGAPILLKEPDNSAVGSAVMMHKAFKELRETWSDKNSEIREIGLGIGISSGKIFLGNVGSQRRFDYTVIGMDVNIAQRLATDARSGEILVTQMVRRDLGSQYSVKEESSRLLKGLKVPIPVFSIAAE